MDLANEQSKAAQGCSVSSANRRSPSDFGCAFEQKVRGSQTMSTVKSGW